MTLTVQETAYGRPETARSDRVTNPGSASGFTQMPVGETLAIFQFSEILTVYWGHRFFNEGQLLRKAAGAAVMAAGAALILPAP